MHHYERLDNRIRVFSNKLNCGCSQTFENALSYVNGEYIAFCDQDDVWRPDKLSIMIDILKNESIGLVYSNCDVIDEESNIKIDNYREINNLVGIDSSHENINEICWFNSFILGCSIVIKFDVLSKVLPILDNSHNHDKWIVSL
ncbi:glycosyltransferase, partial [Photobacterium phosphoreum]|uniref:glycosyltransferase n=1 Tax=Photobacterium phosphoreum TaxID=659 RepID=UPI0011B1D883